MSSAIPVQADQPHEDYIIDDHHSMEEEEDDVSASEDEVEDDYADDGDEEDQDHYAEDEGVYEDDYTDDDEDDQQIFAEDEQDYHPGGLHPVHLDDRLGPEGRYRVANKLGYGGYGTVWLCHDQKESRWRAVKILASRMGGAEECQELATAKQLLERLGLETAHGFQVLLQKHHVAVLIDHFTIEGPNGTHLALVYPLLGTTVEQAFRICAPHPELLKDICFQMVQAMDFLHSSGRCHGDFRSFNVLFRIAEGVDQWPEGKLFEVLGKPKTGPLLRRYPVAPGTTLPDYLVSINYFDYTSGLLLPSVAVIDFGVSFDSKNPPPQTSIPPSSAAPEDMITGIAAPGSPSDVWTLMHTIMEVRTSHKFMAPDGIVPYEADEIGDGAALSNWECTSFMGPMPKNYRAVWKAKGGFFRNGHEDDESVPVVYDARSLPTSRAEWAEVTGTVPGDLLKFYLMADHYTRLDEPLWDAIAGQDHKATGLVPRLPYHSKHWMMQDHISCKLDPVELEQFYDLCKSVYKWQPQERALTGEILNQPWFGDRNKRAALEELDMDEAEDKTTILAAGAAQNKVPGATPDEEMKETTPMLGIASHEQGYGAISSQEEVDKDQGGISLSPLSAALSSLP